DPDADGGQIRLDGLRDSLKRLVLPNPQLDGESLRVARGGEQGAGFCGVVSIGWSRGVGAVERRRDDAGGEGAASADEALQHGAHIDGIVERLPNARIL